MVRVSGGSSRGGGSGSRSGSRSGSSFSIMSSWVVVVVVDTTTTITTTTLPLIVVVVGVVVVVVVVGVVVGVVFVMNGRGGNSSDGKFINDSSSPLPLVVLAGFEPVWTKSGEMSGEMSLTPTTIEKFSKNKKNNEKPSNLRQTIIL